LKPTSSPANIVIAALLSFEGNHQRKGSPYRRRAATSCMGCIRLPPGNRLERLAGDRRGQHSIRINDQWRICFIWRRGDAYDVEIVDYH
jgi:hypothetical protein